MSDREQIEELYRTYWYCMINKDIDGMDRIMADDYELWHMDWTQAGKTGFFPVGNKRRVELFFCEA